MWMPQDFRVSQHCIRSLLRAVRQQAISLTNVYQDLWRRMDGVSRLMYGAEKGWQLQDISFDYNHRYGLSKTISCCRRSEA